MTKKKDTNREILTPPLKWAGGKRWLVSELLPLWKPYSRRRLVEPFCGGLAVALGLRPTHAFLNDQNPHLINFYKKLQLGLRVRKVEMKNESEVFYRNRDAFNASIEIGRIDTVRSASLFYYLNRTSYNGLCRFNSSGKFNVPFGKYKTIGYRKNFLEFQKGAD